MLRRAWNSQGQGTATFKSSLLNLSDRLRNCQDFQGGATLKSVFGNQFHGVRHCLSSRKCKTKKRRSRCHSPSLEFPHSLRKCISQMRLHQYIRIHPQMRLHQCTIMVSFIYVSLGVRAKSMLKSFWNPAVKKAFQLTSATQAPSQRSCCRLETFDCMLRLAATGGR